MMMNNFDYTNTNPLSKHEEDCVIRAINYALDLDYYVVKNKLWLTAELHDCEELCVCCYEKLLQDVYHLKRLDCFKGKTIKEFCKNNPNGIFIIRVEGHLTCVDNGIIKDIWNCEKEKIDIVWQVDF